MNENKQKEVGIGPFNKELVVSLQVLGMPMNHDLMHLGQLSNCAIF